MRYINLLTYLLTYLPLVTFTDTMCGARQAALQTLFIIDASHRRVSTSTQAENKPGRALVTLLLLLNLCFWIVCIFEVKNVENLPMHGEVYGDLPWTIISNLCIPLIIFYRFHSTVCLSEIWSTAYR